MTERRNVEVEVLKTITHTESVSVCDACGGDASKSLEFELVDIDERIEDQHNLHGWHKSEKVGSLGTLIHLCPDCSKHGVGTGIKQADLMMYNTLGNYEDNLEDLKAEIERNTRILFGAAILVSGALLWLTGLVSILIFCVGLIIGFLLGEEAKTLDFVSELINSKDL